MGADGIYDCGHDKPYRDNHNTRCAACHNADYYAQKAARKVQLAAEPRCEVEGCKARGAWRCGAEPAALLCGRHLKAARAKNAPSGAMAYLGMFGGHGGITGAGLVKSLARNPEA